MLVWAEGFFFTFIISALDVSNSIYKFLVDIFSNEQMVSTTVFQNGKNVTLPTLRINIVH